MIFAWTSHAGDPFLWFSGTVPQRYRRGQMADLPGTFLGHRAPEGWSKIAEFAKAFYVGLESAIDLAAEDFADRPDETLWDAAVSAIEDFAPHVPPPLVTPLQLGGVSVEWHLLDLDIEIRFRAGYPPFVVIDDVRGELPAFGGHDLALANSVAALRLLASRRSQPGVIDAAA